MLVSFLSGEFLLHIPCSGEFLLHIPCCLLPMLVLFCSEKILLYVPRTYRVVVVVVFKSGEFLFHILCWLHFYLGSFSYTSRALASFSYTSHAAFFFSFLLSGEFVIPMPCWLLFSFCIWEVSFTHPMLTLFYAGSFSYTSRAVFFNFYLASFSYTSRAVLIFMQGVSVILCLHLFFLSFFFFFLLLLF